MGKEAQGKWQGLLVMNSLPVPMGLLSALKFDPSEGLLH